MNPVRLSVSIMAHPARAEQVADLLGSLGELVPVSWDYAGPPSGDADRVWRNARAAWSMADPSADWHVLLQDDALVCGDFLAGLSAALRHVPDGAVVSGYLGAGRTVGARWQGLARAADERGVAWVRADRIAWGVCLVMPTRMIAPMIEWADRRGGIPDDMRVAGWVKREGLEVWYPWPSLSDHLTIPSLTKHKAADRVAARFHQGSALDIDWSGPVLTDPMLLRRRPLRSGPTLSRPVRSVTTGRRSGKRGDRA